MRSDSAFVDESLSIDGEFRLNKSLPFCLLICVFYRRSVAKAASAAITDVLLLGKQVILMLQMLRQRLMQRQRQIIFTSKSKSASKVSIFVNTICPQASFIEASF
jgi:hypothetical protein